MKYAVTMVSGAVIYIPSFIKTGSDILKFLGGGFTGTQTAWRSYKPTFIFNLFPKVGLCDLHAVCVSVNPPLLSFECLNQSSGNLVCVSWCRPCRNVTATTNTHAIIEGLLDTSFSVRFVSFQRNVRHNS
jgi:hypothetical protein